MMKEAQLWATIVEKFEAQVEPFLEILIATPGFTMPRSITSSDMGVDVVDEKGQKKRVCMLLSKQVGKVVKWDKTKEGLWDRFKDVIKEQRVPLQAAWDTVWPSGGLASGTQFEEYLELWRAEVYRRTLAGTLELKDTEVDLPSPEQPSVPSNYFHDGMLAFVMLGPFSKEPHLSICLWSSPLPGQKPEKAAEKLTPAPTLNAAELRQIQRNQKNIDDIKKGVAKTPTSSSSSSAAASAEIEILTRRATAEERRLELANIEMKDNAYEKVIAQFEKLEDPEAEKMYRAKRARFLIEQFNL